MGCADNPRPLLPLQRVLRGPGELWEPLEPGMPRDPEGLAPKSKIPAGPRSVSFPSCPGGLQVLSWGGSRGSRAGGMRIRDPQDQGSRGREPEQALCVGDPPSPIPGTLPGRAAPFPAGSLLGRVPRAPLSPFPVPPPAPGARVPRDDGKPGHVPQGLRAEHPQ